MRGDISLFTISLFRPLPPDILLRCGIGSTEMRRGFSPLHIRPRDASYPRRYLKNSNIVRIRVVNVIRILLAFSSRASRTRVTRVRLNKYEGGVSRKCSRYNKQRQIVRIERAISSGFVAPVIRHRAASVQPSLIAPRYCVISM